MTARARAVAGPRVARSWSSRAGSLAGARDVRAGRSASPEPAEPARTIDAPLIFVARAARPRRRRARRGRSRAASTRRPSPCSACSPPSAPRCARSARARPAIETVFFLLVLGGPRLRPGLRLRARLDHAVRVGAAHRRRRAVAAVPDAGRVVGRARRRAAAGHARPRRDRAARRVRRGRPLAYGLLMNLWFWPFAAGPGTELSYVAGAPLLENLHRFRSSTVVTSTGLGHRPGDHDGRAAARPGSGRPWRPASSGSAGGLCRCHDGGGGHMTDSIRDAAVTVVGAGRTDGGPDRIRTGDLQRDRLACWATTPRARGSDGGGA